VKIERRIKFIWGASKVIRGKWWFGLVGLYSRREGQREDGIAVSVRGALCWLGVMALMGWVALATAGFLIWQRNPHSLLTYSDALFYPVRRAQIAEKNGQAFIAHGLELARAGKWFDAVNLLRLGLARFPRDFRARLTLSQFYQLTNQNALALKILTDGLGDDYPGRSYLDALFKTAALGENFESVAELSARFLPVVARAGLVADQRWLLEKRYGALTAAERHAEALALAESEGGGALKDERRALSLLALGRTTEALALLTEWRARAGADLKLVSRLEARAFREARKYDEMERALAELRERSPGAPGALVYGVVQQAMAGREAEAKAALANYIFRFGGFADNLALVAAPLAELGNLPLLQQCVTAARERGFPLARFQVFLIDTQIGHGDWEAAGRTLDSLPPAAGKDAMDKIWREWLQLLIEAAKTPGEAPQRALVEFLRGRSWTMGLFRRSVGAMIRAERLEAARDILDVAIRAYPSCKWLQVTAADLKLRLIAQLPAPSSETTGAEAPPPAETAFVRRLEYLLGVKNWDEAARHIAQVQTLVPVPDWLTRREAMVRLAQVRMAQAQRDIAGLGTAARLFLDGAPSRAADLLELAREFFAAGDKAAAIVLAREIVRSTPDNAAAQRSLREWEPAAAAPVATATPATRPATPELDEARSLLAQLRARRAAGDVPGLLAAARLLLTGERARAEQAVVLAREWAADGDPVAAERLIREVLRRHEAFPPARRLLNELTATGPGKK
jgi:hypothetical protein